MANISIFVRSNSQHSKRESKMRHLLTLLIWLLSFCHSAFAQIYPVNINTTIAPPYSIYLSDYCAPGIDKLNVNILISDPTRLGYHVKLRLVIEGEKGTISTPLNYIPRQPIVIDGGVPQYISGSELEEYFNANNLDFVGYSKADYLKTGTLPEGFYRIGFQVLDYNKSIPVSQVGSANAWCLLNDPPIFNTPEKNVTLTATEPQSILFQWMPRQAGLNASFTAEYILQIYEIWPSGVNANQVVASTQPLVEVTSQGTSFLYSNAVETPLIPGRQYAYRVQARDVNDLALFKNHGYSEVQMFTYGAECMAPTNINANATTTKISISWDASEGNTDYKVLYRLANTPTCAWYPQASTQNSAVIDKLNSNTAYEYQVISHCGSITSNPSDIYAITTVAPKTENFTCGIEDEKVPITSTKPLLTLKAKDIITTGKFQTSVINATGANGKFSGEGYTKIPLLGFSLHVTFNDITVNENYQVTTGEIVSVYNANSKFLLNVGGNAQTATSTSTTSTKDTTTTTTSPTTITITSTIEKIEKQPNGDVLITATDGTTTTIHTLADGRQEITDSKGVKTIAPAGSVVSIADGAGNTTSIDKDGKVISESKIMLTTTTQKTTDAIFNDTFILCCFDINSKKLYYSSEGNRILPDIIIEKLKKQWEGEYGNIDVSLRNSFSSENKSQYIYCKRVYKGSSGFILASFTDYELQWRQDLTIFALDLSRPHEFTLGNHELILEFRKKGLDISFEKAGQFNIEITKQETLPILHENDSPPESTLTPCNQGKSIYIDENGDVLYEDLNGDSTYALKTKKTKSDIYSEEGINKNKVSNVNSIGSDAQRIARKELTQIKNKEKQISELSSEAQANFVKIECVSVLKSMYQIVCKDNGKGGNNVANNTEYGGHIAFTNDVREDVSGKASDPCENLIASIDITISGAKATFHSHPSGTNSTTQESEEQSITGFPILITRYCEFEQGPSLVDTENYTVSKYSYVFAMRERIIYIYDGSGIVATIKFSYFDNN